MLAVSLSGGASKGAFQAGAIGHICGELEIDPVLWTGTSVGALNALGACHAKMGDPVELSRRIFDQWHRLQGNPSVYNTNPHLVSAVLDLLTGETNPLTKHAIYDTAPLWDYMQGIYDRDAVLGSGRLCSLVAVSLSTGQTGEWRETDPDLLTGALASAAMPVVFPAVRARGDWWIDGGIRDVRPIRQAIERGATKIYDISTDPAVLSPDDRGAWSVLDVALRTLGIMVDEITRTDQGVLCEEAGVEVVSIRPEDDLGDPLDFSREHVHEMLSMGVDAARKALA